MLSEADQVDFQERGFLRLPGIVPAGTALTVRDRLWGFLSAIHGRHPDDPNSWTPLDARAHFSTLSRTGAFSEIGSCLEGPVTDVLGQGRWSVPDYWGQPLVTFPQPELHWAIPSMGWHVDAHQWSVGELPGLIVLTLLDEVSPQGGGTLLMAGSHHLTWQLCQEAGGYMKTGEMKVALSRRFPWFAELWREDRATGDESLREGFVADGVPIHLVELHGAAGDVVLMNQRLLHVATPNTADMTRLMLRDALDVRPAVAAEP